MVKQGIFKEKREDSLIEFTSRERELIKELESESYETMGAGS